ncbi:UNVERIFIED_CONTAM: hypothetical protein K2H54_073797 [Gekko kuhli]
MAIPNRTEEGPLLFILMDIPGLGSAHRWLVVPLGSIAVLAEACFAQLFSIHTFSVIESAVLLAMAFDRFVAIWNPLRYASVLTGATVAKMGVAIVFRSVGLHLPLPFMLRELRYGTARALSHSYCLHPDVLRLACVDTRVNSAYGLFVLLSTLGLDSVLILLSYVVILRTVLSIATWKERLKALNTCVSHICAVLLFYTPLLSLSMIHRFGKKMPPQVYLLLSYLHFLLPPVLNPVIYSVKTKEIRRRVFGVLQCKGLGFRL